MIRYYLAVSVLALLNLASIGLCLWLAQRLFRLEKQVAGQSEQTDIASGGSYRTSGTATAPAVSSPTDFATSLMGSEMNRRLQDGTSHREPPEKYRYVASLAGQGMSAAEIAKILHLAPGEVEQLVSLARISGLAGGEKHPPEEKPKEAAAADRKG